MFGTMGNMHMSVQHEMHICRRSAYAFSRMPSVSAASRAACSHFSVGGSSP